MILVVSGKNKLTLTKSMVDTYRKTKFVASGSAAAALKMKSNESGAGRFTDFMLSPLTFFEFLQLQKMDGCVMEVKDRSICPYDTLDIDALNRYFHMLLYFCDKALKFVPKWNLFVPKGLGNMIAKGTEYGNEVIY